MLRRVSCTTRCVEYRGRAALQRQVNCPPGCGLQPSRSLFNARKFVGPASSDLRYPQPLSRWDWKAAPAADFESAPALLEPFAPALRHPPRLTDASSPAAAPHKSAPALPDAGSISLDQEPWDRWPNSESGN